MMAVIDGIERLMQYISIEEEKISRDLMSEDDVHAVDGRGRWPWMMAMDNSVDGMVGPGLALLSPKQGV